MKAGRVNATTMSVPSIRRRADPQGFSDARGGASFGVEDGAAAHGGGVVGEEGAGEGEELLGARVEDAVDGRAAVPFGGDEPAPHEAAQVRGTFHPYPTMAEGLELAAQTFDRDVAKLSSCAA